MLWSPWVYHRKNEGRFVQKMEIRKWWEKIQKMRKREFRHPSSLHINNCTNIHTTHHEVTRTKMACPPTWTTGVTSGVRKAAHDVVTICVKRSNGIWSSWTNFRMTLMAKSTYDRDCHAFNSSGVTVGIESGTNKPLSDASPCITTERKSKWSCSPRVEE